MASTSQNYKKPSTSRIEHHPSGPQSPGSPHRSRLQEHHRAKDRWPKRHGKEGGKEGRDGRDGRDGGRDGREGRDFMGKEGVEYSTKDPLRGVDATSPDFLPSQNNNSALRNWKQRAKSTENLLSPSHRPKRSARSGSQPDLLRGSHGQGETSTIARSISGRLPPYQPELLASAMFDSDEDDTESVYSLDKLRSRSRSMPSRQSSTERYRMHCHCNCANKTLVSRREVKRTTGRGEVVGGGSGRGTPPINGIQEIDDPPVPKQKGKQLVSREVRSKSSDRKSGTRIQTTAETYEPRPNTSRESPLQDRSPWGYMAASPRLAGKVYDLGSSRDTASTPSTSSPVAMVGSSPRHRLSSPHHRAPSSTSSPQRSSPSTAAGAASGGGYGTGGGSGYGGSGAVSPYENINASSYHRQDCVSLHNQYPLYPTWDDAVSPPRWDDTLAHRRGTSRQDSPPIYEKVSPGVGQIGDTMRAEGSYPRFTVGGETMEMRPETVAGTYPRHDAAAFSPAAKPRMPRSVSSQQLPTRRREAAKLDSVVAPERTDRSGLTEMERRRREHSSESSLARLDCVHARQKQLLQQHSSSSSFTSQDDIVLEKYSEEPRNRWRAGGENNVLPPHHNNECRKCVIERRARRETYEAGTAVSTEIFLKEDAATGKKQFVKISTV